MIGIDSSALIDFFKGNVDLAKLLSKIDDKIVSTQINYFEVIVGIDITDRRYHNEKFFFDNIFRDIKLFTLDISSSNLASKILWDLKKRGKTVGKFDIMVSAILLSNGVHKIITKNKKHFENISGVEVISY